MGVSGTSPAAGSASYTSSAFQKLPCRLSVAIVLVRPAALSKSVLMDLALFGGRARALARTADDNAVVDGGC